VNRCAITLNDDGQDIAFDESTAAIRPPNASRTRSEPMACKATGLASGNPMTANCASSGAVIVHRWVPSFYLCVGPWVDVGHHVRWVSKQTAMRCRSEINQLVQQRPQRGDSDVAEIASMVAGEPG
jgi:hypothetical protein